MPSVTASVGTISSAVVADGSLSTTTVVVSVTSSFVVRTVSPVGSFDDPFSVVSPFVDGTITVDSVIFVT
jgi:hypothetical protein